MRARLWGPATAVALLAAMPAGAYLLPAQSILSRAAKKRGEARAGQLVVHGTLALYGEAAQRASVAEGLPTPAVLRFTAPAQSQLELAGMLACQRQGPKPPSCAGPAAVLLGDAVPLLAARRSSDALADWLAARGVDLNVVSLARQGGRVAYVIGARPREAQARPQLWLDKEGFMPLRLWAQVADGSWVEILFQGWSKPPLFDQWPRVVEVRRGGALEARLVAESAERPAGANEVAAPAPVAGAEEEP